MGRVIGLLAALGLLSLSVVRAQLYNLPAANAALDTSGSMDITARGRLVIANPLTDSLAVVQPVSGALEAEIGVGRGPQHVAITSDNAQALVTSADGRLHVVNLSEGSIQAAHPVGADPAAVVTDSAEVAYVALSGEAAVVEIDIATGEVLARIATPPAPVGLALWGDMLYITHRDDGQFSLIYRPTRQLVRTIATAPHSTQALSLAIDTRAGWAYVPHMLDNRDRPHIPVAERLVPVVSVIDLATLTLRDTINLVVADRPLSQPIAATLNQRRTLLYIAHAGSNGVTALDLDAGVALAHLPTGANPRDVLFARDNLTLYIHEATDHTLAQMETRFNTLTDRLPTTQRPIAPDVLIGARLFHSAADPRMSLQHAANCASCHHSPRHLPTPTPEAAALAEHIRATQGGSGLDPASLDMAALLAYLRAAN